MQQRALHTLIGATWLAIACSCGSPPPPPPPPDTCIHVDGRGAGTPDGSAAHPFASIDAAIAALGAAGGDVCLTAGEHAPPTAPISIPLTVIGASSTDSTISASAIGGACLHVDGLFLNSGALGPGEAVIEARADLTLRDVGVHGCVVGVHVASGTTVLERVSLDGVQTGVDVDASAALATTDTHISLRGVVGAITIPGGVVSQGSTSLMIGPGTEIQGAGLSAGVYVTGADVVVDAAMLHDLTFGVVALSNDAHMVEVHDTMLDTLAAVPDLTDPTMRLGGLNFVSGGGAMLDHVTVTDAEQYAFVSNGATVTIDSSSFSGASQLVRIQGGTATITGSLGLSGGDLGLAAVHDTVHPTMPPAVVHVMGPITSTSTSATHIAHVMADDGGSLTLEAAGSTFTGGGIGLAAWGGSHLVASAGATVTGAQIAVGSFEPGTMTQITGLVATPTQFGLLASEATTEMTDAMLMGGQHPIAMLDGTLRMTGGMIQASTSAGVRMFGGDAMLDSVMIDHAGGAGISIEGGTLGLTAVRVVSSGDSGIVSHGAPTLVVSGSTFDANLGAAIALYGGDLTVTTSTFMPSMPTMAGRSDEIRITAETGGTASLDVSGSTFQLDTVTCAPDTCTVIMSSGVGAQAIVRPNCITAPDTNVMEGLEQDGGTIMDMTGMPFRLRSVAGQLVSPGAFPAMPGVAGVPMPPAIAGVTRGI